MKKLIAGIVTLMIVIIAASSAFAAAADIQFSGYTWFRYTSLAQRFSDKNYDTSKMSVEKLYLTWTMKYSDSLNGNITLDLPMKSGNTANSDWTTIVKFAYVDVRQAVPNFGVVRVGVQPMNFCMIDKWSYPLIEKSVEDVNGLISSADLGVSVLGPLPGFLRLPDGWADYSFLATNGNGFAKPTGTDSNIATCARFNAKVAPGLSLSISQYTSQMSSGDAYARAGINAQKSFSGVAANYFVGPFWLMGEWITGKLPNATTSNSTNISASSLLFQYTLNDKWNFIARTDLYNPNTDLPGGSALNSTNAPQTRIMYGINYQWFQDLLLQVNYEELACKDGPDKTTDPNARATSDCVLVQLKWSY